MTSESAVPGDDPHRLLSTTRELTRRVRKTQRATWFPLLVFAAVTFAAVPAYRAGRHRGACATTADGLTICRVAYRAALVYWPIVLVLAYVAIAAFYLRRSQASGVGTRVRPYVVAGIIIAVAVTGVALWIYHYPLLFGQGERLALLGRLVTPASAIGLALLVLAWAERSGALLVLDIGYLAVVLVPISFGWSVHRPGWGFLPQLVVDGGILLLGGLGFMLAQRPWRGAA